jgi:hypothetical protein
LPDLRFDVDALSAVNPAAGHQHIAIGECGVGWIPSSIVHISQVRPAVGEGRVEVGVWQPDVILYVSTSYEQATIR